MSPTKKHSNLAYFFYRRTDHNTIFSLINLRKCEMNKPASIVIKSAFAIQEIRAGYHGFVSRIHK